MRAIQFDSVNYTAPGGVEVLKSVTLGVEGGELVAIVGGNGAGKTTLLKHMNGLLKPSSGGVQVFGVSTKSASVAQLSRDVGLVFQNSDHQLFSESVKEEIAFGLRNFGTGEKELATKVEAAAQFYGLSGLLDRAPLTLSGGEKKRVCIAAVMAWQPKVLALDEPTVGQDAANKAKLSSLVSEVLGEGRTVVLVSHDIEFLWPLHPRTVVMSGGKVMADAPADEVFMDSELLARSGLRQPQLAQLSVAAGRSRPFGGVDEAASWLGGT